MKRILLTFFVIFIFYTSFSQKVLDAPFVMQKLSVNQPYPANYNTWQLMDTSIDEGKPFYNVSHLYTEPEYARVRVLRTIDYTNNPHFAEDIERLAWVKRDSVWILNKDGELSEVDIKNDYSFKPHLPWWVRKFLGVNIRAIQNHPKEYTYAKMAYSRFEESIMQHIEKGDILINKAGILQLNREYIPEIFQTFPLNELIFERMQQGFVTAYNDQNFTLPLTRLESLLKVPNKEIIRGIRLKEDFFIDPVTKKITSTVIGFSLLNEKKEGLVWFYYPELRYVLKDNGTIVNDILYDYMYVFDEHHYKSEIDTIYPFSGIYYNNNPDDEYLLKLMPKTQILLHEQENPNVEKLGKVIYNINGSLGKLSLNYENNKVNGKYKAYYPNGNLNNSGQFKEGLDNGQFDFFYKEGKLKAKRNYVNGTLNGEQINYFNNGSVYANYTVDNDMILYLERYYHDGQLMEKGSFEKGLFYGDWEYNIKCSEEHLNLINKHTDDKEYFKYKNGIIHFRVNYEHIIQDNCPFVYFGDDYESICTKAKIIN